MAKKIFDFFVFSSLFIALCAVMMVYLTTQIFGINFPFELGGFVFAGSVCSYNFHWYLTPPGASSSKKEKWNVQNRSVHLSLFLTGVAASAYFSLLLIHHWFWLLITAFFTFLYSAPKIPHPLFASLKKVALGKTIFLAFAWTHVTSLLPFVLISPGLSQAEILFVINRFLFIYAICILFDYRDVESDREAGIKSMITYLDDAGVNRLFWSAIVFFFISCGLLLYYFSWVNVVILAIPAIVLCFLYRPAKNNFSDYLYYFVLDGLMMLSAPLLLLTKFGA